MLPPGFPNQFIFRDQFTSSIIGFQHDTFCCRIYDLKKVINRQLLSLILDTRWLNEGKLITASFLNQVAAHFLGELHLVWCVLTLWNCQSSLCWNDKSLWETWAGRLFENAPCDVKLKWISPARAATAEVKRDALCCSAGKIIFLWAEGPILFLACHLSTNKEICGGFSLTRIQVPLNSANRN